MEKFSSIERIVGGASDEVKNRLLKDKEERFANQSFKELEEMEREKTQEEKQMINIANILTDNVLGAYGLKTFNIPENNIHIIRKNKWPKENTAGIYNSQLQGVAILEKNQKIVMMKTLIHEMLHFKSYNAWQLTRNKPSELDEYRVGVSVNSRDGKQMYFRNLNEAITEEITKRLLRQLHSNPLFSSDIEQTKKVIARNPDARTRSGGLLFNEDTYFVQHEKNGAVNSYCFTKFSERTILKNLIEKLYVKNQDVFENKEEIFEMFAKSMMTGNIIPIGKLIDKTFGKHTFRHMGELDDNIMEQERFVNSL